MENETYEQHLKRFCRTVNKTCDRIEAFNESLLYYAKNPSFDRRILSKKFRDYMILCDGIKRTEDLFQL